MADAAPASVFLSYAHADRAFADRLAGALSLLEIPLWVDLRELRIGDSIIERVSQAIADGDFLLAIVSPASLRSSWCQQELAWAATHGIGGHRIVVLPIRYQGAAMPAMLADRYWADADATDVAALADRIARDIERHRGNTPSNTDKAWLRSALQIIEIENPTVRERCLFHLTAAERAGVATARIDGSAHHRAADRLTRLGALSIERMPGSWMILRMTPRGRNLLAAIRDDA